MYGPGGELLHSPSSKHCAPHKGAATVSKPPSNVPPGGLCTAGSCRTGDGTYSWPNGARYVGRFLNGKPHGHGTHIQADGGSYVGGWRNGKQHGQGLAISVDGRTQSGLWQAGRFVESNSQPPASPAPAVHWPDLSRPARKVGGGKRDAAVVIGIEDYAHVPDIARASENASAWYRYLVKTREIPVENVTLLIDEDATVEEMLDAAQEAASRVERRGTLWFIFIGHGAPSKNARDGLLIGFDAQQKTRSVEARSLTQSQLLATLEKSRAKKVNVLLDACFSGRIGSGDQLIAGLQPLVVTSLEASSDPRTTLLTAARGDEYAGPLPGAGRPAFSYLALGGLRGWADRNSDGSVTAGELHRYVSGAMRALIRGRRQRPTLLGKSDVSLARSPQERGPDLSSLVLDSSLGSGTGRR